MLCVARTFLLCQERRKRQAGRLLLRAQRYEKLAGWPRDVGKVCQSCLARCWLSRFLSLIPLLSLSYPSLIPLLSLSYLSLIPFFHLRFIFVSGLFFLRLEMRVVWDRNGNRSCMVPSVCNEFPFIAFIPHLVKMGDDSFCHIGSLSDKIPSMAGPECFGTPFVLN